MTHILWIIYLFILGITSIGFLLKGGYRTPAAKVDFVISLITWIGLFGYVTDTHIFTPIVWKVIFVGALLWDVVFSLNSRHYNGETMFKELPRPLRNTFILLTLIMTIGPLYYGLFRYAFNGSDLLSSIGFFIVLPVLAALIIGTRLKGGEEEMETKQVVLPFDWTLIVHESYSLYTNQDDSHKFVVLDQENNSVVTFSVDEDVYETHSTTFEFKQKINASKRIIEIIHEPDEEWN
ncbi:hypothetical protein NLX67_15840 [Domibacillus sp. A3M-37]|uniref:hypothetical protein n=1 Tax=Domibacillus TaxID=1433999 RepID=UPI0020B6D419|nr:hypothetical protein [Domibacillus sp. A3M-37]MCP3763844.1 hypothetical protein [Domibacillus sp. A3M-37]